MTSRISSTTTDDPREQSLTETRIDSLKKAYIEDEISEQEFDTFLDAALDGGPPFRKEWFKARRDVRRKRYAENVVFLFQGEEYVIKDGKAVLADDDEIDRTINVKGGGTPDETEVEFIEEGEGLSDEARERQDELREAILGSNKSR